MALRHPVAALLFLLMGSLVAAWGLLNLRFDDDVVRAFRSDSETYRAFAAIEAERGALNSIIVTATAPDALDADDLKALRELHYDLEFVDNVDAVMSLFSLRHRGDGLEPGEPVVPDEFGAAEVATILATARADRLTPGRIVSDDGRALMFLIVDDGASTARESRRALLSAIENAVSARATQRLRIDVLGHDAIRFEIADAIKHDLLLFTTGGGFVSMLLALFWFRSVRLTLLAVAPPVIAVLWVLGFSALAGIPLSVTTDVVPVLLIVVSFTDSMHLVHALRVEPISPGDRTADALRRVILRVGPACVLTSLTTALAMLSLALTRYGALTDVALMGGGGVIVAFFAVILAFPAFGIVLVRDSDLGRHSDDAVPGKGFAQAVARIFPARPRLIVALAILVLSAGAIGHLTNRPDFNTYENVPENSGTLAASVEAETRFGGLFTLWAPVTGQPGAPLASPAGWARLKAAHEAVEAVAGAHSVVSPLTFARIAGHPDTALTDTERERVPEWFRRQFGDPADDKAWLAVFVGDPNRTEESRVRFDAILAAAGSSGLHLAGTPAIVRSDGPRLVEQLNISLLGSAIAAIGIILLAVRRRGLLFAVTLSNAMAVLLTGALLHVIADGRMTVAAGLAMTIAFGIAVDDTIHFLNRALQNRKAGLSPEAALTETVERLGPVLAATTLILVGGLALTLLSDFSTVRDFGILSVAILVTALVADLMVLPAALLVSKGWCRR